MTGGRIGADGIHGATFSSAVLDESAPVQAVQIGDPITQKMMFDFLLEARDQGLYRAITDNGAGGLSSSVGEMAQSSGGAELDAIYIGNMAAGGFVKQEHIGPLLAGEIGMSGVPDESCLRIAITGIVNLDGHPVPADSGVDIRVLAGDTNDSGVTNLTDMALVKSLNGNSVTCP